MKPAQFQIVYDGPALDNHEMDVYDLAPALMAIGGLMEKVGKAHLKRGVLALKWSQWQRIYWLTR